MSLVRINITNGEGFVRKGKVSSLKNETMRISYTLSSRCTVAKEQSRDPATQEGGSKEAPVRIQFDSCSASASRKIIWLNQRRPVEGQKGR